MTKLVRFINDLTKTIGRVAGMLVFTIAIISGFTNVYAQAPLDENFDDDTLFDITSNNFDNDGVNYQITGTTTYRAATYNSAFNLSEGGATDYALLFDKNAEGGISSITISASNGSAFELVGMSMDFLSDTDIQFTSNNGGNFTLSPNDGMYVLYQDYDFTLQPGFDNITSFTISGTNMVGDIDDLNFEAVIDSNGDLVAAAGVTEPVALPATATSTAGAVDVLDFTISDGGGDAYTLDVTAMDVNVSGTSTDAERGQVTWRLNGPAAANVTGIYDASTDKITFSGLSISIPESGSETYTINAYYNDNTNLTEDHTFVLTVDGDTDFTLVNNGLKTQMGTTSAVNNGTGTPIDITATQLAFTTQPTGSVSGSALTTQPAVTALDATGNTDVDFTETITLTEASAGTLTNNTQAATNGVSTFTNLIYTATADQESFTLTANDQDGVGGNLPTVAANSVTSDVVASKLVFNTQPAPTSFKADGTATSFTTVPVIAAVDANDVVDTGYSTGITLAEVNGTGSATLTDTGGDTDGAASTVTITPASGVSTFTGLEIDYTLNEVNTDENFNLQATSGGLTSANSTQLTSVGNIAPTVSGLPTDITVLEETQSNVDLSGTIFSDADGDDLTITLAASTGRFGTPTDGSGVGAGVTETLVNSTTITLAGAAADINTYLSTASNITYTGDTNVSGEDAADITVYANDGQINPNLGTVNLDITDINDAPTLSATGQNPTFIEGDAAPGTDLYSGVTASTIEAAQGFAGLSLMVTNVSNDASEILRFDGSYVALTDGNSVITATYNLTVDVSVTGSTATVNFTGASLSEAQMQTLVDGLAYRNTSENPDVEDDRVVIISQITDDGGTANGGVDTATPNLQSTVSLTAVNSAPVLGNLNGDNLGVQSGGLSTRIDYGGDATVSEPDSDDYNGGYLRVVDNGGNNTANGNFSLDGTNVTANGDAAISAGETIAVGGTAIGTVHATNDGQGGNSLEINFTSANANNARIQTLVRHIHWGSAAGSGAQTFTLTLSDGDGTANGGDEDGSAAFTMTLGNPPEIANLDGDAVDFLVDGPPVTLGVLAAATLTDVDAPASLNGGNLTATVSSGAAASEDILTLNATGAVSLSGSTAGSNVSVSGTIVGTLGNSIAAGNDLQVNFNTNATLARVEVLLQNLQYANNTSPVTEASRQISVTVTDNDGLPSDPATVTMNTTTRPEVSNLSVSGTLQYDQTLTAEYDFYDEDGDLESGTTFQWYRSEDASGSGKVAIAGADNNTYILTQADIQKYISFEVTPSDGGFTGTTIESTIDGPVVSPFAGGEGTQVAPYQVATATQLNYVRDFLDNYFQQTADIDLGVSPWNDGDGWEPIEGAEGGDEGPGAEPGPDPGFFGNYDGQGFKIQNLFINRPSSHYVGLFGYMNGAVSNVGLVSVDINGEGRAGAIAAIAKGGEISTSYSTGTVKGGNGVGGLVGYVQTETSIYDSYSTADVEGDNEIGGFVGIMQGDAISNSYSTGSVTSNSSGLDGGFIGYLVTGSVTHSFWDTETSTYTTSPGRNDTGSPGGTGKDSQEMRGKFTFTDSDWDFDTVWQIDEPQNGSISYPYLQNNTQDPVPGYLEVNAPTVITDVNLTNITSDSVDISGEVTNDGSLEVTERGFTWATTDNPSATTIVWVSSGMGSFSTTVTDLPPGTELTIRAIAVNLADSAYGDPVSFETEKGELLVDGSFTATGKEYDGDPSAEFDENSLGLDGIYSGHDVQFGDITLEFDNANAGEDKEVTLKSAALAGDDAGKYTVSLTNAPTAMADITHRPITVTADEQQVIYGVSEPELTYEITAGSLVSGEQISGSLEREDGQDVGTYDIQQGDLTAGSNYDLSYEKADFEIKPRELEIVVKSGQSKTYGDNDPSYTYKVISDGWNDDMMSIFHGELIRTAGETVGLYEIGQGNLNAGNNYSIIFTADDFEITAKELTVKADKNQQKTYGESDPGVFTYTASNFAEGDDESVLNGSLTRETGEEAGGYVITGDDLSAGINYQISFESEEFEILPAELTISAVEDQLKIYGESDSDFAWSADGFQFSDNEQILSGELNREIGEDTGHYELTVGTLDAGENYTIIYTPATFEITPATLVVRADDDQWKFEGVTDPELTFTADGFVFNDDESLFVGAPGRESGDTPGVYGILEGTLSAGNNYDIDFTGTDFAILRTPPVVENRSPDEYEERIAIDAPINVEFDHEIAIVDAGLITLTDGAGQTTTLNASVDEANLTLTHSGLAYHTEYTLSIGEDALQNVDEIGNEAAEWSFTTILPVPIAESFSPVAGATHVGVNEPLAVEFSQDISIADASGLIIESETGESPAEISAELIENALSITHSGLENLTEYTVTIPAGTVQNAHEVGNESVSWSFTSIVPIPDLVVLAAPVNLEGAIALDTSFEWEPARHAVNYHIQVSNSETFEALVADADQLTELSFVPNDPLRDYRTYFWRVKASNDAGESEWSDVSRFTTLANTPGAVFPMMNAENISTAPMPEWYSDYQTTYRVQLAGSGEFEDLVADTLTAEQAIQFAGLNEDAEYFWRVRVETDSTTSDWTDAIRFRTRPAASTEDDEQVVDHSVTFGETSNREERVISELDYRMVGLPGDNRHGVEDFFPGKYGREWKVFYENGNDTEYYDEYDEGEDQFVFAPGRGFWVLSTDVMNLDLKISSVKTNDRDAYSVPLHPGWNIITNPHRGPVSWSDVQEMNNFNSDAWGYDQQFVLADTLHPVQGYYVYNHPGHPLDYIDIPYATMDQRRSEKQSAGKLLAQSKQVTANVRLMADFDESESFTSEIVYPGETGENDVDAADPETHRRYYPSLEMSRSGMMLVNEDVTSRGGLLRDVARQSQPDAEDGYEIHLKGKVGSDFTWKAAVEGLPDQTALLLVNPVNSQSWLITGENEVQSKLTEPNSEYNLYIGDKAELEQKQQNLIPHEFELTPNYPNPFNPVTNIRYSLPEQQHVKLEVYDVIGRRVQVLTNDVQQSGWHVVQFDGSRLASGVYLYRLTTDNNVKVRKMTLVK